ncbi:uncharacterized protein C10orf143 homolog isoform X2 [Suricata suricatta]|uniref:uncharacterized protein C10orf143 homolog isoform X2 n=1 Tax=Suricata suricatta TaxID=37032 RepID=UPI001155EDA2|nr:uncharacterized protein C10orf143 homolog isoform X2 [Suricata suricatta]
MDTLPPGPWRRRRPEELQVPGDAFPPLHVFPHPPLPGREAQCHLTPCHRSTPLPGTVLLGHRLSFYKEGFKPHWPQQGGRLTLLPIVYGEAGVQEIGSGAGLPPGEGRRPRVLEQRRGAAGRRAVVATRGDATERREEPGPAVPEVRRGRALRQLLACPQRHNAFFFDTVRREKRSSGVTIGKEKINCYFQMIQLPAWRIQEKLRLKC